MLYSATIQTFFSQFCALEKSKLCDHIIFRYHFFVLFFFFLPTSFRTEGRRGAGNLFLHRYVAVVCIMYRCITSNSQSKRAIVCLERYFREGTLWATADRSCCYIACVASCSPSLSVLSKEKILLPSVPGFPLTLFDMTNTCPAPLSLILCTYDPERK